MAAFVSVDDEPHNEQGIVSVGEVKAMQLSDEDLVNIAVEDENFKAQKKSGSPGSPPKSASPKGKKSAEMDAVSPVRNLRFVVDILAV